MKKLILTSLLVFLSTWVYAQTTHIMCGTVTNLSGNPIPNHPVHITGDTSVNPLNTYHRVIHTDINGHYCDTLNFSNTSYSYIVSVQDCQNYHHNQTVNLNNVNTPVNFQICHNNTTPTTCHICGTIVTTNSLPNTDSSHVYLIQYDSLTQMLVAVDSTLSHSNTPNGSQYCFYNVSSGTYLVKAALSPGNPGYANHIPTYYGNALLWNFATHVQVCPTVNSVNITFIAGANPGGPGFIGGLVTQGANKTQSTALAGVTVYLKDDSGNHIAWTLTDANGAYNFNSLAYGTYHIWVDALNLFAAEKIVVISGSNPSITDGDIEMSLNPVSLHPELMQNLLSVSVYPNPAQDNANLKWTGIPTGSKLEVRAYSASGQIMGNYTISDSGLLNIDCRNWAAGLYLLQVRNSDNYQSVVKLQVRH